MWSKWSWSFIASTTPEPCSLPADLLYFPSSHLYPAIYSPLTEILPYFGSFPQSTYLAFILSLYSHFFLFTTCIKDCVSSAGNECIEGGGIHCPGWIKGVCSLHFFLEVLLSEEWSDGGSVTSLASTLVPKNISSGIYHNHFNTYTPLTHSSLMRQLVLLFMACCMIK